MAWQSYQVIFRLRTPAHIGWGEVGNLLRTRSYITGRVLWGALTMRLTRHTTDAQHVAPNAQDYQRVGMQVHEVLAYTYFYPATRNADGHQMVWPWENPAQFRYRFLSSYGSTALSYPQQAAANGMLHEVEFLVPHTKDTIEPVFLVGYIFASDKCILPWQAACQYLQIGGERSYGWGDLELMSCQPAGNSLFENQVLFDGSRERPILQLKKAQTLLAHTHASRVSANGDVEPLVGREWRRHPGQHVAHTGICFVPGSKLKEDLEVKIGNFGVWE